MTGNDYRKIIKQLGLSQVGAAKFLGVDPSTSRRWIANDSPIPLAVAILLRVMVKQDLSPDDVA